MDKESLKSTRLATRAVHAGSEPDPHTGAVIVPIYQTSTFAQEKAGVTKGYEYSRAANPTRSAYEKALAIMEGVRYGVAFSSGMSAVDTVIKTLLPGDRVLAGDDLYGGTYRLFTTIYKPMGFNFDFIDLSGNCDPTPNISEKTKLVWLESPTNPLLKVTDIARICKIAHDRNIPVVVDNTFMSPALQHPFELGADIVVHSTTKYIGGHSDTIGGAIVTDNEEFFEKFKYIQKSAGAVPGPFDCFIAHRGLKTLPLRMERHSKSAMAVAQFLEGHKNVEKVIYPFLESHPDYEIAKRQQEAGGGMVSFVVKGDKQKALDLVASTRVFALAESLGGVESLIEHPAIMTHASIPPELRAEKGISDNLIRLSIGIEDVEDLIEDLEKVLG